MVVAGTPATLLRWLTACRWCGRPFLVSRLFDVPSIGVDSLPWAVLVAIALGLLALLSLHLRTR